MKNERFASFEGKTALVTGANRGIGRALVTSLLERGAARVYATSRSGGIAVVGAGGAADRTVGLRLDVTDQASVDEASRAILALDVVINNAGTLASYSVLSDDLEKIERDIETNFMGTLRVARAFAPVLARAKPGALINVLSIVSLASKPFVGGYCASKAAAFSLTQSLRAELAPLGITVHGVFPGSVDTDMIKSFPGEKASPIDVARATLDGIEAGEEDIAPDVMSREAIATWLASPRMLERRFRGE